MWSVFGWNMNVEQAREVSHAAHGSLFATTEQLQMPHTAVCQSLMQPTKICLPQLNSYRCHTQLCASLWCSPWQSVCHNWTTSDATYSYMPGCEFILNVIAGWFICVWILFMWYQNMKTSCRVDFRDEETSEPTTERLSRENRTNSLTWEVTRFYPSWHFLK